MHMVDCEPFAAALLNVIHIIPYFLGACTTGIPSGTARIVEWRRFVRGGELRHGSSARRKGAQKYIDKPSCRIYPVHLRLLSRTGQSAGPRSRHPSIPRTTGDTLPPYRLVVNNESSRCLLVPISRHYAHCRVSSSFGRMSRLSATGRGVP